VAYDVELADRLRDQLEATPTTEKRMFGGLAFLVGGNMAVAASSKGGLMVRCAPEETDTHLAAGATPFEMRGKPMDGWLRVPAESVADDASLARWVAVGVAQAEALPPK
jgi:TfoX/Sxy family transcriptional regulator of competence genes